MNCLSGDVLYVQYWPAGSAQPPRQTSIMVKREPSMVIRMNSSAVQYLLYSTLVLTAFYSTRSALQYLRRCDLPSGKKVHSDFSDPFYSKWGLPSVSEPRGSVSPWMGRFSTLRRRQGAHDGSPDSLEPHDAVWPLGHVIDASPGRSPELPRWPAPA